MPLLKQNQAVGLQYNQSKRREFSLFIFFLFSTELLESVRSSPSDRMTIVSKKIASLGKMYVHSERYFPLGEYKLLRDIECLPRDSCDSRVQKYADPLTVFELQNSSFVASHYSCRWQYVEWF